MARLGPGPALTWPTKDGAALLRNNKNNPTAGGGAARSHYLQPWASDSQYYYNERVSAIYREKHIYIQHAVCLRHNNTVSGIWISRHKASRQVDAN